jgi:hypothetical protein
MYSTRCTIKHTRKDSQEGRINTAELAKDNVDKAVGHFDGVDRKFETGEVRWPF